MPKKFFISFWERSGSTFLVDLLNQHPEIYCREEILAGVESPPYDPPFSDEEAWKKINIIYSNKEKLCQGFKFKFPQQHFNFSNVARQLYQKKAVIFLYRKNLVKLFVSKLNQLALKKEFGVSNTTEKICLSHKIRWDPSQDQFFHNYLNAAMAYSLSVYKNAKRLSPFFYSMCYEDLFTDTENSLRLLFGFLGVDQSENIQADSSILTKISSDAIEKNFENPDEFVRFVEKTQLKGCLAGEGEEIENWHTAYQVLSGKTWPTLASFEEKIF